MEQHSDLDEGFEFPVAVVRYVLRTLYEKTRVFVTGHASVLGNF